MTSSRAIALCAALLCLAGTAAAQKTPTAQELIQQAHKLTDLSGLGSYVLTGTVLVNPGTKTELRGSIGVQRDHDRVRVDVAIANQVETRVTLDNKDYLDAGKMLFNGTWLYEFDRLWDPERRQKKVFIGRLKSSSVSRHKIGGKDTLCVDSKYEKGDEQFCVDAKSSLPLSFDSGEFLDYTTAANGASYPKAVKIAAQFGGLPIEVRDIRISPYQVDASLFEIPPHATEFETCQDATPPQLVEAPTPARSDLSRHAVTSNIVVYAFVDKQGKVTTAKFLTRVPPGVETSAAEAIKKWQFQPASCDGKPVNFATTLQLDWHLF